MGILQTRKFHIVDYAQYDFNVTPEMAAETKSGLPAKATRNLKPTSPN